MPRSTGASDMIVGDDGKPRCAWVGGRDRRSSVTHDEVWGVRTDDEAAIFEALTLGVFEVGLSWSIVFGKRDAFRTAFHGFDVPKVAAMTDHDVDRLTEDASIIRNRAKIQATVDNARAMMSASPGLPALVGSYEVARKRAPRSLAYLPKTTPQAEAFAEQLKSQGYRFVGPTKRVRVHAERRSRQRPCPRVLLRERLPSHGPEPHSPARARRSPSIAAVTRSATADGVEASSLPSRCRNASPWTSAQIAGASASGSPRGKHLATISRRYSDTAAVAATRSWLSRSHGSPNIIRNRAGCSRANST